MTCTYCGALLDAGACPEGCGPVDSGVTAGVWAATAALAIVGSLLLIAAWEHGQTLMSALIGWLS